MTSRLLLLYKQRISEFKLIPSSGGCFELSLDGELLFSKLAANKFPDEDWVVDTIEARLKK